MAVVRKMFSGTISGNGTQEYVNYIGITSEDSENRVTTNVEMTLHFLNSLCQTLIEAGYEDTTVNEEGYYITILGERFYFIVEKSSTTNVDGYLKSFYIKGSSSPINTISNSLTYNKNINYRIIVRGDKNHVSINLQGNKDIYGSLDNEYQLLHIMNMKNVISQSDSILITNRLYNCGVCDYVIKDRNNPYTIFYYSITNTTGANGILHNNYSLMGNNSNEKIVVLPLIAYYGNYLIPSMIGCNTYVCKQGGYYKIGTDTYYCEGGSLYKID